MKLFGGLPSGSRNPYVLTRSSSMQLAQSKEGLSSGRPSSSGSGRSGVRPIQEEASVGGNDNIYFLDSHLSPLAEAWPAVPS